MKKALIIILLFILVFLGKKGVTMYQKLRHASRLKIGVAKFKLKRISSDISAELQLQISNYSTTKFTINQVSIDAFTIDGNQLATQQNPLANEIVVNPNQTTTLPLSFSIGLPVLIQQIKKIGGIVSTTANYLTTGKYGLQLNLKGFVVAENTKLNINEIVHI